MKLTPQQNQVINCLQNGWIFVCDSESRNVTVACKDFQFTIGSRLFWNLHDLGLTHQDCTSYKADNEWKLTELGMQVITKDVQQKIKESLNPITP